jgi:hypothetical protein
VGVLVGVFVGGRVPLGVTVGVSVGTTVGVSVGTGVSVDVAEGTTVGKNWVGVGSRVEVGSLGVKVGTGSVGTAGVLVGGGRVTKGVAVSENGGGAVVNAMIPRQ